MLGAVYNMRDVQVSAPSGLRIDAAGGVEVKTAVACAAASVNGL
jgi:hypothetical protein